MLQWLLRNVVLKLIAIPVRRRLVAFEEATRHPREMQEALLARILRHQSSTAFGTDHHFAAIRTVADYRHNLPVRGYDYVEPYLKRVLKGETNQYYRDFVQAMKQIGYDGYLSYELCHDLPPVNGQTPGIEFAHHNAQLAAKFMRQLIDAP